MIGTRDSIGPNRESLLVRADELSERRERWGKARRENDDIERPLADKPQRVRSVRGGLHVVLFRLEPVKEGITYYVFIVNDEYRWLILRHDSVPV